MIQQPLLSKDQYRYLSKQIIRSIETKFRILPLNSLKHPRYRLRVPMYISIEFENDQVIASLEDIEAFAYAETISEAIDCLCSEIIQIYEDLKENEEDIGPLPEKWLQFLEDIIECR